MTVNYNKSHLLMTPSAAATPEMIFVAGINVTPLAPVCIDISYGKYYSWMSVSLFLQPFLSLPKGLIKLVNK